MSNKELPHKASTRIETGPSASPGDGIRTLRTSGVFRAVNFELYAKPVRYKELIRRDDFIKTFEFSE